MHCRRNAKNKQTNNGRRLSYAKISLYRNLNPVIYLICLPNPTSTPTAGDMAWDTDPSIVGYSGKSGAAVAQARSHPLTCAMSFRSGTTMATARNSCLRLSGRLDLTHETSRHRDATFCITKTEHEQQEETRRSTNCNKKHHFRGSIINSTKRAQQKNKPNR